MENNEQVSGKEPNKNTIQKGTPRPNPTRNNRTNLGGNTDVNPDEPDKEVTEFDSDNNESEINPGKLDREEIDLDHTGNSDSKGHQPYEFRDQQTNPSRSTPTGAGISNKSAKGKSSSVSSKKDSKSQPPQEKLLGQTHAGGSGFNTSGTSGTNSGGMQRS